jgi:hypothetical protein
MLLYTNYRRQNDLGQSRSVQRKRFAAVEASSVLGFFVGWRLTTTLLVDPDTSACALADLRGPTAATPRMSHPDPP